MKYNVGDKVRIKPKFHFCSVDGFNNINMKDEFFNQYSRLSYCETVMTIGIVNKDFYILKEDKWAYKWTDEMIEGLVEEEARWDDEFSISWVNEFSLPDGYIFKDENGNVINATKIVLEKKKKEYPKTYEECYQITELLKTSDIYGYKNGLLFEFQKLLIARDAYWKIAGEEMVLRKPWKPDWTKDEWSYMAYISYNGKSIDKQNGFPCCNTILTFPTAEMRDAFYENFKSEIEFCKELL